MKIQKTGPDSVLMVFSAAELKSKDDLRQRAFEALKQEGIPAGNAPELTAYTAGDKTVVFVNASVTADTYFGFDSASDLLDAAYEAERLFPDAGARLYRVGRRLYLATPCHHASELLREYAVDVIEHDTFCEDCEMMIAHSAFQILSGRC